MENVSHNTSFDSNEEDEHELSRAASQPQLLEAPDFRGQGQLRKCDINQ